MGFHDMPRPPRIVALGGPVTAAIRAMRADEPATDYTRIRELRRAIADRIEADLALLDALCGDADFEQDAGDMAEGGMFGRSLDDEPSLGSLCGNADQSMWDLGGSDDREGEHDGREPDEDLEPTLCGITVNPAFASGKAMATSEDEPSLGSVGGEGSQLRWSDGNRRDLEISAPTKTHNKTWVFREAGEALTETRAALRRRQGASRELRVLGPDSSVYAVRALPRLA